MPLPPTRTAALAQLEKFLPLAAKYASTRNFDLGPDHHTGVSQLSPYLRTRLITEEETTRAVLGKHSPRAAEKFLQEIAWRTYWKGWLEMRPTAWHHYTSTLTSLEKQRNLPDYQNAISGNTPIPCFNHWATELTSTGYLHNHARMWFASIWVFTLRLPWQLGADFFYRHLLDGDPASNTLSWRWVGGLHTKGKTYLARAANIAEFTNEPPPSAIACIVGITVPIVKRRPPSRMVRAIESEPSSSKSAGVKGGPSSSRTTRLPAAASS